MGRITARTRITRITLGESGAESTVSRREDILAVEEPLEIRVGGSSLSITMRTPGHDFDLAAGFLISEGVVAHATDIAAIRYCAGVTDDGENTFNVLDVTLGKGVPAPDPSLERNFYMTSSCGLCGKASIDAVRTASHHPVADDELVIDAHLLATFPDRLRAAALFDGRTGEMLVLREDVGRHNAVDKVIGWAHGEGLLPLTGMILQVSGRASFELTQKASMAGIPVLAAVSAPSSLAIDLAHELGMTVVGFMRGRSMVVYAGEQRVTVPEFAAAEASR
jgi:FdhD protein